MAEKRSLRFEAAAQRALDTAAARGAAYADVRFEEDSSERIEVRNGHVGTLEDGTSTGYGMRAFYEGSWGFAASADTSDAGLDATAARAVEIAKAGASVATRRFGEAPTHNYVDRFATPVDKDPADIPLGKRVELLLEAEKGVHVGPLVAVGRAWIDLWHTEKEFYSSSGSKIAQSLYQTGSGLSALAVGEGDAQDRSFPGDIGLYQTGGWEIVEEAQLRENAARIGEEAVALLTAPQCPSGTMDIVLGGSQVSLQIHESCGHAAELDRIMGWEANFSGTSFLDPAELGKLKYGSDKVTIVIDNTLPRGLCDGGLRRRGDEKRAVRHHRATAFWPASRCRAIPRAAIGRASNALRARGELARASR